MDVVYANHPLVLRGPSVFLAGPTPRHPNVPSWRPEAIRALDQLAFPGTVLVPERQDWNAQFDYLNQVEWEFAALERAEVLLFWVPRDPTVLPGFTTNVEFGRYVASGRLVYGRPVGRPHNRYLDWLYEKVTGLSPHADLAETVSAAARLAAERYAHAATNARPDRP